MMTDYFRFKKEFERKSNGNDNPWKALVDFNGLRMKDNELIDEYVARYQCSMRLVNEDGCAAVKFFFSLPSRVRELLSHHTGEWPTNLKGMMDLSQLVVTRDQAIHYNKPFNDRNIVATTTRVQIVCFGCGEKGHIVSRCPKTNESNNKEMTKVSSDKFINFKSNSVKDSFSNYPCSSSVYVLAVINLRDKELRLSALVDSGASANFISESIVRREKMFKSRLKKPVRLELAAKSFVVYARHETEMMTIKIGNHFEEIQFIVVPELQEEIILGKVWLDKHNPLIDWPTGELTFSRCSCVVEKLPEPIVVETKDVSFGEPRGITEPYVNNEQVFRINHAFNLGEEETESNHDEGNDFEWDSDENNGEFGK